MERCVVNNRVFLLGLDALYRKAMKRHERVELLICARKVAGALRIRPVDVPVEGYYADDEYLAEYFRLLRALQDVDGSRTHEVASLPAFLRLREVVGAPLFGIARDEGGLLPVGADSLTQALIETRPGWTIPTLTDAAAATARVIDDCSLVGLAARAEDPVVLAALRESVVLYAQMAWIGMDADKVFVWNVDPDLAEAAQRFIATFNALFNEHVPPADPTQAETYWEAHEDAKILGRCVCLGHDDTRSPVRHYHWAICRQADGELMVHEFWREKIWTTTMYRANPGFEGSAGA